MGRGQGNSQLAPQSRGNKITAGIERGTNKASRGLSRINQFFAEKFGMGKRERLALAGTVLAAPTAALAGPVLGLGLALALTAPHLHRRAKEVKSYHEEISAEDFEEIPLNGINQEIDFPSEADEEEEEARQAAQEEIADLVPAAEEEIQELRAQITEQQRLFQTFVEDESKRQQELLDQINVERRKAEEAESALQDHLVEQADLQNRHAAESERADNAEQRAKDAEQALQQTADDGQTGAQSFYQPRTAENRSQFPPSGIMPLEVHWAEHILRGDSPFEFRRSRGNGRRLKPGSRVAIYAKNPAKAIIGYADVEDTIIGEPDDVWQQLESREDFDQFGYTEEEFHSHCYKAKEITLIKFANVQRLQEPLSLDDLQIPGESKKKGTKLQGFRCFENNSQEDWHQQILEECENNDQKLADERGVPSGRGSKTPEDLLELALKTVAKAERRDGQQYSALAEHRHQTS